jgi:hypothetical protein
LEIEVKGQESKVTNQLLVLGSQCQFSLGVGGSGFRGRENHPFEAGEGQVNAGRVHVMHGGAGEFAEGGDHVVADEAKTGFIKFADGATKGAAEECGLDNDIFACQL